MRLKSKAGWLRTKAPKPSSPKSSGEPPSSKNYSTQSPRFPKATRRSFQPRSSTKASKRTTKSGVSDACHERPTANVRKNFGQLLRFEKTRPANGNQRLDDCSLGARISQMNFDRVATIRVKGLNNWLESHILAFTAVSENG